jgi:hypothetical protein
MPVRIPKKVKQRGGGNPRRYLQEWITRYGEDQIVAVETTPFDRVVIFAATPRTFRERWAIFRKKARPNLHVLRQEDRALGDAAIFI